MSQGDEKVDDLTRGEWIEPISPVRPLMPERPLRTGCRTGLAVETRNLLQGRLRAASLIMAIAFVAFLVRDFVRAERVWLLIDIHVVLTLFLVANVAALSTRWQPTMHQLRRLELATFGLILAGFIAGQVLGFSVHLAGGEPDPSELRLLFKNSIIGTLLLILTYGIFIPNEWRRGVWIILLMAVAPLAAPALLGLMSPDFRHVAHQAWSPERLTENGMFLALAAAIAIFGTFTINRVHDDAFRARWLNQYRLTRKLGAGGMGEVFLAEHEMLKRPCAIKLIRPGLAAKPRVLARFEREAQATAQLSHWNTIEVYDYGRADDGTFYYVMEYLPGLSLQQLVERHGPLPPGRVIYLLRQACEALAEAHEAGLIHRDLKPPNIFASYRGGRYDVAKLLDFGLVKATRDDESPSLTREGMVTGSPLYMAPEQVLRTHTPDARTDLYALGAIAYFLLTGRPPFTGPDSMTVMVSQARDPVQPPSKILADVPADVEAVVLRCLEKDPDRRFQDASSLGRALAACRDDGGWSPEQARDWWLEHEPDVRDGPGAAASTEAAGSRTGRDDLEQDDLTLGGSAVEISQPFSGEVKLSLSPDVELDELDRPR